MKAADLLPCPFCPDGGRPDFDSRLASAGEWVACDECGSTAPDAETWNRRTADTEPASPKLAIQDVVVEMKRRRSLAETRGMIGRCVEFDSLIHWIEQQMQEAGGRPAEPAADELPVAVD